tara:strand:+ start:368 stop:1330 length:963 start_codon:yes stop_codon:yes gene_type:complete
MSIKIKGTSAQIEALRAKLQQEANKNCPEFGEGKELGVLGKVKANTQGLLQRDTLYYTLDKMGAVSNQKFTPISVARFPDGRKHTYDGDHRRHLWGLTWGYDTDIPAYIKDVADEAEYHRLFASANGKDRKNLNSNEIFFHEYHGKVPEAMADGKRLMQCGVSLRGSSDGEEDAFVGDPRDPQVSIGGFRKSLQYDIPNVIQAVATLKLAWPKEKIFQTELLSAMALLYKTYPVLKTARKGAKIPWEFQLWFAKHLSITNQKKMARKWKSDGGNVHHKATESVALGILREFLSVNLPGGSLSKDKVLVRAPLKALLESNS